MIDTGLGLGSGEGGGGGTETCIANYSNTRKFVNGKVCDCCAETRNYLSKKIKIGA